MARLPHSPDEATEVRPYSHIPTPDAWIQCRQEAVPSLPQCPPCIIGQCQAPRLILLGPLTVKSFIPSFSSYFIFFFQNKVSRAVPFLLQRIHSFPTSILGFTFRPAFSVSTEKSLCTGRSNTSFLLNLFRTCAHFEEVKST